LINGKNVLAVIPARGGSKGLPGKNIKELCGKPLIAWTILRGNESEYIDELVVSTDSQEIADISLEYGGNVPFMRPAEYSSDTAATLCVVEHALDYYLTEKCVAFEYLVLLEPTSPLREAGDIDRMIEKLELLSSDYDSIVSVGEVNEHPSLMKKVEMGSVTPFCDDLPQTTRRQDNDSAYFPYGVAYISKVNSLINEKTFYTERCLSYKIKRYQNYEIDDIYDFYCIESIMKKKWELE